MHQTQLTTTQRLAMYAGNVALSAFAQRWLLLHQLLLLLKMANLMCRKLQKLQGHCDN